MCTLRFEQDPFQLGVQPLTTAILNKNPLTLFDPTQAEKSKMLCGRSVRDNQNNSNLGMKHNMNAWPLGLSFTLYNMHYNKNNYIDLRMFTGLSIMKVKSLKKDFAGISNHNKEKHEIISASIFFYGNLATFFINKSFFRRWSQNQPV